MPESRKRPGHHEYRKPADIPASQRAKGRVIATILLGIFGFLILYFGTNDGIIWPAVGGLLGCVAGYFIGKRMERGDT